MIDDLIKKYEEHYKSIINPDDFSWKDLGFKKAPKGFETVEDYMAGEGDFDEGEQTSMSLISEVLEDLKNIKKEKS